MLVVLFAWSMLVPYDQPLHGLHHKAQAILTPYADTCRSFRKPAPCLNKIK